MLKKGIRMLVAIGLVMGLVLGAAGCGQQQSQAPPGSAAPTQTLTDQLGRQVTLPAQVKRIVSINIITTAAIYAVQAQDLLVATNGPTQSSPFFQKVDPERGKLPNIGSPKGLNIETIVSLKPDVVIAPGTNKGLVQQLEAQGLTVLAIVPETLDGLKESIALLGKALGKTEAAQKFLDYYDQKINQVKSVTAAIPKDKRPRVYLGGASGLLSTCSTDMIQHAMIELAGGQNVASEITKGGWSKVSLEQVLKWNPEVIIIPKYASEDSPESILKDKRLAQVPAVKNKRVYWFADDGQSWDMPGPKAVLGILWLAKTLHPDKFKDLDLKQEIDNFYKTFFNSSFDTIKPLVPGL